jgi:hypothetical protein
LDTVPIEISFDRWADVHANPFDPMYDLGLAEFVWLHARIAFQTRSYLPVVRVLVRSMTILQREHAHGKSLPSLCKTFSLQ